MDRAGLLGVGQHLYAASKNKPSFLHTRFALGADALEPDKAIIERWASPDGCKNQIYSVAKAKKPIADCRKAAGQPGGIAELTVFSCEQTIAFSNEVTLDGGYYGALGSRFEQALSARLHEVPVTVVATGQTFDEVAAGRSISNGSDPGGTQCDPP